MRSPNPTSILLELALVGSLEHLGLVLCLMLLTLLKAQLGKALLEVVKSGLCLTFLSCLFASQELLADVAEFHLR